MAIVHDDVDAASADAAARRSGGLTAGPGADPV